MPGEGVAPVEADAGSRCVTLIAPPLAFLCSLFSRPTPQAQPPLAIWRALVWTAPLRQHRTAEPNPL